MTGKISHESRGKQRRRALLKLLAEDDHLESELSLTMKAATSATKHLIAMQGSLASILAHPILAMGPREGLADSGDTPEMPKDGNDVDQLFRIYRVRPETLKYLVDVVRRETLVPQGQPYEPGQSTRMTLMFLGGSPIDTIVRKFSIRTNQAQAAINRVIGIFANLASQFIRWPTPAVSKQAATKFKSICGFPGIIGVVGACHVILKKPPLDHPDLGLYLNSTEACSTVLIVTVDHEGKFIHVETDYPGSMGVREALQTSPHHKSMLSDPQGLFPTSNFHVIGDHKFPLSKHLLIPYSRPETELDKTFNDNLHRTRECVDVVMTALRMRFPRLENAGPNHAKVTLASCVLHNIITTFPLESNTLVEVEGQPAIADYDSGFGGNAGESLDFSADQDSKDKRDSVRNMFL